MSKPVFEQLDRLADHKDEEFDPRRRKGSRSNRTRRVRVAVDEYLRGERADDPDAL